MSDTALAVAVATLFLTAYAALVVTAVVQVLRSPMIATSWKIGWVAGVLIAPLVGSVAWFLVGNKTSQLESALGTAGR